MRNLIGSLVLCCSSFSAMAQQPCRLEITVAGAEGDTILLANYYGNRLFYSDTAVANAQGLAVFARKSGYTPGLYAVLPGKGRVNIVLNEPLIQLATEAADPAGRLRVIASRENTIYHVERKAAEALPEPQRSAALNELITANSGTLAAMLIRMEQEPAKAEVRAANGALDSVATADRFRDHYWDNTDLHDERIVNGPVFQNRLEALLAIGLPQQADVITNYLDSLIARAGQASEVRRFIVTLAIKKYQDLETQGLGAVCVRMAQRYVCTGAAGTAGPEWKPQDQWRKTCVLAARKASLLIGAKSRDLVLADTTAKKWVSLHEMPQSCIVAVFWSPNCSHCKQAMPVLYEKYVSELKALDVGVYAVAEATDNKLFTDWKAFIKENKLDWVNVGVPAPIYTEWKRNPAKFDGGPSSRESLAYAETWEVANTPKFYVLDRDRRIVASPASIKDIITVVKAHQAQVH